MCAGKNGMVCENRYRTYRDSKFASEIDLALSTYQ